MEPKKVLCVAGPTEGDCGEMYYSGSSSQHANGVTTESILINTVGNLDYLVFLNRELGTDIPIILFRMKTDS